jgi:hypothetical protein
MAAKWKKQNSNPSFFNLKARQFSSVSCGTLEAVYQGYRAGCPGQGEGRRMLRKWARKQARRSRIDELLSCVD